MARGRPRKNPVEADDGVSQLENNEIEQDIDDESPVIFPALVYRCPGDHHCPGGTFNYLSVNDYEELGSAIENGWCETIESAMEK